MRYWVLLLALGLGLALCQGGLAATKEDPLSKPFMAAADDLKHGHYEEAARFYRIIRSTYKGSDWEARAGLYLAQCYQKMGKAEDQRDTLRQVAEAFGQREEGLEARFELAHIEEEAGDVEGALQQYSKAVVGMPEHPLAPYALLNMATLQARARQDEAAMVSFTRLASEYPSNAMAQREASLGKARLLRHGRHFAEAASAYQAIIQGNPQGSPAHMQARLSLAHTWQQAGQYDRAAQAYAALAKDEPSMADQARVYQGLSLIADGRSKEAREPLQAVVDARNGTMWEEVAAKALANIQASPAPVPGAAH